MKGAEVKWPRAKIDWGVGPEPEAVGGSARGRRNRASLGHKPEQRHMEGRGKQKWAERKIEDKFGKLTIQMSNMQGQREDRGRDPATESQLVAVQHGFNPD